MKHNHNSNQFEEIKTVVNTLHDFLSKGGQLTELRSIFEDLDSYLSKVKDKDETKAVITTLKQFIAKGGQIEELKAIIDTMDEHLEKEAQQRTAVVTTANELTEKQQQEISEQLQNYYQKPIDCEFAVDSAVLGGMKIKIYDHIMDMTIDNALETMVQTLKH